MAMADRRRARTLAELQLKMDRLVTKAGFAVGLGQIGLAVMANDFKEHLVGAVDVFVLDVNDWIDEVLAHQGPKAIFKPEAGEKRGFVGGGLTIEVEFGGPPGENPVFELDVHGSEPVGIFWLAEGGFALNF